MPWIEMSRDPVHGGGDWGFLKCLWSPTSKADGSSQGWWKNFEHVRAGDPVVHLRGVGDEAKFIGMSICSADPEVTSRRPPDPGEWGYAMRFYRAPLSNFESFGDGISLELLFNKRDDELRAYFLKNKGRPPSQKRTLFYVIQAGRLQCQNGAYLSEADTELLELILGFGLDTRGTPTVSIETGERLTTAMARIRQNAFSTAVKRNYCGRCCFPDCPVRDDRFLVGSHIARWTDVPELRGEIANGLCLCLMHDRAFEYGYFTIDDFMRIRALSRSYSSDWAKENILPYDAEQIKEASVRPSEEALLHHWLRIGF